MDLDPGGAQGFDLLAAASEDERVAAFQAHDALAQAGLLQQQVVDLRLRHGMVRALLADIEAVGVAAGQVHDPVADEAVIDDDVGLGQKAQRLERQQFGIAGTGADKMHDAFAGRMVFERLQRLFHGFVNTACARRLGGGGGQNLLPDAAAVVDIAEPFAQRRAQGFGERGDMGFGRRYGGLDAAARLARQHRRGSARGDADAQGAAIDDGREMEVAEVGIVDHVQRRAGLTGEGGAALGQRAILERHHDQGGAG